jgi:hypothetical protein
MEAGVIRRYEDVEIIEGVARGQRIEVGVGGDDGGWSSSVEDGGIRI